MRFCLHSEAGQDRHQKLLPGPDQSLEARGAFASLLTLAGVLGISEGHLHHQESQRLRSGILPNLEILFKVSLMCLWQ